MKKVHISKRFNEFMENLMAYALLFAFIAAFFTIGWRTHEIFASQNELLDAETIKYVVVEGDRLWNIAQNETGFDNLDPRDVVDQIQKINNLDSVDIYPGDVILIPVKK